VTRRPRLTTGFRVAGCTLLIDLDKRVKVLSSAPCRGGLVRARYIVNHQVQANPIGVATGRKRRHRDPAKELRQIARESGGDDDVVALMTAVPMQQLVVLREEAEGLWVEGFMTVGVSNAVRAGEPIECDARRLRERPGTINIVVITNARLPASALVEAVQVATESKAAVLLAAGVRSWTGRPGATGTGTDAVVVACDAGGDGPTLRYSGTHTKLGELIGRLVARGVREGLQRSARWSKRNRSAS